MTVQGGASGEVHLLRPWDPHADVAVPIRRDRSAGHHTLSDVGYLSGQSLVHDEPPPGKRTSHPAAGTWCH